MGAVSRIEDKSGSTAYDRDAQSRITAKTQAVNDNPSNPSQFRTAYAYANGDLASITYPSGLNIFYRRTAGRITGIDVQEPGGTARKPKPVMSFVSNLSHTALELQAAPVMPGTEDENVPLTELDPLCLLDRLEFGASHGFARFQPPDAAEPSARPAARPGRRALRGRSSRRARWRPWRSSPAGLRQPWRTRPL